MQDTARTGGFTVMEMLIVIGVIAILVAVAMPAYNRYIARAYASELAARYDAVRTKVAAQVQSTTAERCSDVSASVNPANLQSQYAAMDVAFEAVPDGYTPVMRFCSTAGAKGNLGVDVARETHHLLSRSATIGKGAVIGDAAVSFSVELADGAAVCKVAPAVAAKDVGGCSLGVPATAAANPTTPPVVAVQPPQPNPVGAPALIAAMAESVATDFSQPPITGTWMSQDPTVWGWNTDNPDGKVEYGKGAAYGDTSGGNIGVIELEGFANHPSNLYRTINAQPGAKYEFGFDLTGRVGVASDSAAVEILWEGKVVDTLYPAANAFGFVHHTYNLVATGSSSRIELRAVTRDGSGPVVDNLGMAFKGLQGTANP